MTTIPQALAQAVQYHQAGNLARAENIYRQILQANPADGNALHLLGMLAHQRGQHEAAVALIRQAVDVLPQVAEFHSNLATVYLALGRSDEAIASCGQALRLRPDLPELHHNLGTALMQQGKWEEAGVCYRQVLVLRPTDAEGHQKLGLVLEQQGQVEESLASLQEALRLRPDFQEAHFNLANVLKDVGRLAEAEDSYRAALRLQPDNADVLNNLGIAQAEQGRFEEALANYQLALRLRHDYPKAHNNVGLALTALGRPDEALVCFEQALRIQPDYAEARNNLANSYRDLWRVDDAIACYRKAIATKPEVLTIQSNLLLTLHYHPGYDPATIFAEHLRWAGHFVASQVRHRPLQPINRDPCRRLRIGYVSPDLCEHVMGRYGEAVIAAHDRGQVEVFCYANVLRADALTQRVMASADHWRSIMGLPDARAADLIGQDQIDLLIDLAGHTGGTRLGVFARKPAPLQVTHLGYPASTGLAAIDYRLTDAHCDPPGWTERFHTETLMRLPEAQLCYPLPPGPEVGPLPARRAGQVTFGSFNNPCKVTEDMIGLWALILNSLPGCGMVVLTGKAGCGGEALRAAFVQHGVGPERVKLVGRQSREAYFRLHQEVDICLDTYPYSGGFTTADALWMGVPVVSLVGPTCVSRQGIAALTQVGLGDLVTETPQAYVEAAVRLAQDLPRLQDLRSHLRDRLESSPLADVRGFTRHLEAAYRGMWERFCREDSV